MASRPRLTSVYHMTAPVPIVETSSLTVTVLRWTSKRLMVMDNGNICSETRTELSTRNEQILHMMTWQKVTYLFGYVDASLWNNKKNANDIHRVQFLHNQPQHTERCLTCAHSQRERGHYRDSFRGEIKTQMVMAPFSERITRCVKWTATHMQHRW